MCYRLWVLNSKYSFLSCTILEAEVSSQSTNTVVFSRDTPSSQQGAFPKFLQCALITHFLSELIAPWGSHPSNIIASPSPICKYHHSGDKTSVQGFWCHSLVHSWVESRKEFRKDSENSTGRCVRKISAAGVGVAGRRWRGNARPGYTRFKNTNEPL